LLRQAPVHKLALGSLKSVFIYLSLLPSRNVAHIQHPPSQHLRIESITTTTLGYHPPSLKPSHFLTQHAMPSSSSSSGIAGRPSSRLAPKITTGSSSSGSSGYPASSRSVTETKYRSGAADGFYTSVKDVPSSRGGASTVLIQQTRSSS
jgi:hypothetical protein